MRILIIGGDGMLGHCLLRYLGSRFQTRVTVRKSLEPRAGGPALADSVYGGVDVRDEVAVRTAVHDFRPDAVFNAAGIVKQRDSAFDAAHCIEVNSLFPHRLATICADIGARLVHYSTDCVFSGDRGGYSESDLAAPPDLYGQSKLLGEVATEGCITLRTSMVGFELERKSGLLEWFLSQNGPVKGWRRAVFSGLTTLEHARIAERILLHAPFRSGIFHVGGAPISKFALLTMIKHQFGLDTDIEADDSVVVDRSLDSTKFQREFGYSPPAWEPMIGELARLRGGR